ncbi:putative protease [Alcanivorax xiamenensis]|uniref:Ubiquinone biosynthesis protein UbiV n=1 Tax=Alcanivorax xiamenensis TaxID=1177156 RepID=A0ABQ6YA46_9GAMM|nr:U32 family peptidase [Alcanivorax xiamenensis]KAF0806697.1 putative protease [Alcanivorax xiamenensis]
MLDLALGPVPFYWHQKDYETFYAQAVGWPLERVYLGETVCGRRRDMKLDHWLGLARELRAQGKAVVLSSQTLIEAGADLRALRRLCDNGELPVEANDMSAVHLLSEAGIPFIGGASLNLYNVEAIRLLAASGMQGWHAPLELSRQALTTLMTALRRQGLALPCEVHAYGHLALAWSARCFTARRRGLPKDRCQFVCRDDPQGLPLFSQDGRRLFTLNGIQTLSAWPQDLRRELPVMAEMGVSTARLVVADEPMAEIVAAFDQVRRGQPDHRDPLALVDEARCDGYWHGAPGMDRR